MEAQILSFTNQNGKTVYNPTAPFEHNNKRCIGVRLESHESELDSQTFFAYEVDKNANLWEIDYSLNPLPLQDPTYTKIKDEIFILGVKVEQERNKIKWRQDIYRGSSIENLKYFTSGPIGMKDIRLVDLDDKVGVFTRPQGKIGGRGKIGYLEIENINKLTTFTEEDWYNAKLIDGLFDNHSWGGVNQATKLDNDRIGVIGHIAHQTAIGRKKFTKHYYGISFQFNPQTWETSEFQIIAKRKDFPQSPSKRSPELDDIIFPAGIDPKTDTLYCGLSDHCIGQKKIKNPI